MSNEMVERVARALFDSLSGKVHNTQWDFGAGGVNVSEELKERYRAMARAAIEAMMEPTEAMISASGCECGLNSVDSDHEEYVKSDFRAMLQAALKEGE